MASSPIAPALRTSAPSFASVIAATGGCAGGGDPDLVDQLSPLPLGNRLHGADEHVEHVHAECDHVHDSTAGCVMP